MGHLTPLSYRRLQKRMDRFVPGVPHSEFLYEILRILFTDDEARLCSVMPLTYFDIPRISRIWGKSEEESAAVLKTLADKGLVFEFPLDGVPRYVLAPPVLGFFEFSLMRMDDGRFDRQKLSEYYYRYLNMEKDFIREYLSVYPQVARVLVHENAVEEYVSEVLPYEKASEIIGSARCVTVGTCFCRHKMEHLGMACDNPQDVCLTFNDVAEYLVRHGIARKISRAEAKRILDDCVERGLVQIADNKKNQPAIICNCCGCCCDMLLAYKRLGVSHTINPSNFISTITVEDCNGCGVCESRCPVDAIAMSNDRPVINEEICLGCGVCARFCPTGACRMGMREEKPLVPDTMLEKLFLGSVHQGKTGNFIFDEPGRLTHRIMREALNAVVKIPPVRNLLTDRRFYNRFLRYLEKTEKYEKDGGLSP